MTRGARGLIAAADQIEARIAEAEKLRTALEQIQRLHAPIIMPTDCVPVCSMCCFDEAGYQTSDCMDSHEHSDSGPACSTAEIIARAGL